MAGGGEVGAEEFCYYVGRWRHVEGLGEWWRVGQEFAEVGGGVGAEREHVVAASFAVGGLDRDGRDFAVEAETGSRQAGEFAGAEACFDGQPVEHRALGAGHVGTFGAATGGVQQPAEFGYIQRAAWTAFVGFRV